MATENAPEPELPDVPERWTAKRKVAVIMEVMKGTISVPEACRRYGIAQGEYQDWVERFMQGGENALKAKPKEEAELQEQRIKGLQAKIGELVMDIDILKKFSALRQQSD
jgi:transposase-like protein